MAKVVVTPLVQFNQQCGTLVTNQACTARPWVDGFDASEVNGHLNSLGYHDNLKSHAC
jgi:hypothetical protein